MLDFAIVGVTHCGTSALQWNLRNHPEIVFVGGQVEFDWEPLRSRRLLPTKDEIAMFNEQGRIEEAKKAPGARHKERGGVGKPPLLRGVNFNAMIRAEAYELHALLMTNPNLRAVVVLCDPVDRFEKRAWLFHFCGEQWLGAGGTKPCISSIRDVANSSRTWSFLATKTGATRLGSLLRRLRTFFRERLLVIHQQTLLARPRAAYDFVARFLGAGAFGPEASFDVVNAAKGHRTDLCRQGLEDVLRLVKRKHARDYAAIREVLQDSWRWLPESLRPGELQDIWVPERIYERQSRCDLPGELAPGRATCGRNSTCGAL